MDKLSISLDKICYLIEKGHELEVTGPSGDMSGDELHAEDPDIEEMKAPANDPVTDEMASFFENLNEDEGLDLVTLMWIGRGTYEPEDWLEARNVAAKAATHSVSDYLLGTPLLAEHLENGLEAFGMSCGT